MPLKITVLIPLFNEKENVRLIAQSIENVFTPMPDYDYEILFVDDGSTDKTLETVKELALEQKNIFYLSFSRNFGKDNALLAGFQYTDGDAVVTIDADMQHPPEMIPTLLKWWQKGHDIVYTYRKKGNQNTTVLSQFASKIFYRAITKLADIRLETGLSDFRLVDRNVISVIRDIKEDAPFFRGIFKWVGYKQKGIAYTPSPRLNGESKYPPKALIRLALHSITSFSTKPLTLALYIGFFSSFISILYIPYVLYSLLNGLAISGWASVIVTIAFFGGVQLIILGIIGLYLGKVFTQFKHRPRFIIREKNIKIVNTSVVEEV